VTHPRRYRAALRVYPAGYRASRASELLATLADGDDDRGRPSTREALALAHHGLLMRARLGVEAEGLLVAASVLVIVALTGGFTWAEHQFLFRGEVGAMLFVAPDRWWALALGVTAFTAIAAGPFTALDRPRRTRAALLAGLFALAPFVSPRYLLTSGPDARAVLEYLVWVPQAIFANWQLLLPESLAAVVGTWVALTALGRLHPQRRVQALGATLVILATVVIVQTWKRPDLSTDDPRAAFQGYARSAFDDLGAAAFISTAALLVAVAALWRARPRRAARLPSS
jgi:hypothetical protein